MKVTSAILTTMSGKLGGAVAATARGGVKYFRALVFPSNPQTTRQNFMRAAATALTAIWRGTLTDAQRAGWSDLATDEESGIDVFVGNNSQLLRGELAYAAAAPVTRSVAFANIPDAGELYTEDTGEALVTIANGKRAVTTGGKLLVYASSGNQSPSRLAQQFPFQFVSAIAQDGTTTAASLDINSFLTRPWAVGVGDGTKIGYLRLVGVEADGQVTGDLTFRLTNDEA